MTALREFVADLMETEGAVIDAVEPDGLDVMAPDRLRTLFGWPELARLGFGARAPAGSIPIGLEDDWLDRFGALLKNRGRFAERQASFVPGAAAAPNDPQRSIDRALVLPNAVWRLKGIEPDWSRCLLLAFRYTAVSDEKREGLVWLGFNCNTGAILDDELIAALLGSLDASSLGAGASVLPGVGTAGEARADDWLMPGPTLSQAAGPMWDATTLAARVAPLIDRVVRADLEPFTAAMRRRLDRDRRRVHAYHDDLRRDALLKLASLEHPSGGQKPADKASNKIEAAIERERMRIAAIEREYAAKLEDLKHNYALSVEVAWVQTLVLVTPVQRHNLLIKRRKGERTVAMDWHAAVRRMEPAPSDWGDGLGRVRLVCDDQLHLTGPEAQAPCPSCGKPFCRACCPTACPRCRKPILGWR